MPAEWYGPIWIHPAFICYYMPMDFPDFERDALQAEYESLLYPCMLELMNDYADIPWWLTEEQKTYLQNRLLEDSETVVIEENPEEETPYGTIVPFLPKTDQTE